MSTQQQEIVGPQLYQEQIGTIADSFTRSELGLLIGAGMSIGSQIPDGLAMAQRMLRRAVLGRDQEANDQCAQVEKLAARYPFEAVAQFLNRKLAHHDLVNWLREQGNIGKAKPNDAHRHLRELRDHYPHVFPKIIFTTNFDTLIEDELNNGRPAGHERARCLSSDNITDLPVARAARQIVVAHLHGCVTYPRSIVFGEKELATQRGTMFDLLRSALATDIFVIVGYSLGDTDLRTLFFDIQDIVETRRGLSKRTFAVSPAAGRLDDSRSEAAIAREFWDQRGNVEHLAMSAAEFLSTLSEAVTNHVMLKLKQEVAASLKMDIATLQSILQSAAEGFRVVKPEDLLIYLYYSLSPLEEQ